MTTTRPLRIGVNGAAGRMGATVCEAVAADETLVLAAAVDPAAAGREVCGVTVAADLRAFAENDCEVVVDFTTVEVARTTLPWLALHGIHAVVGTTGFGEDDLATIERDFSTGPANCLIAANFSVSAVLMMRFAEIAASWFDTAEIIEYHHDHKIDAPSGTAIATAERMAAALRSPLGDRTEVQRFAGSRGGSGPGGIAIHAVRMRGMLAHQEVILGALGQTLTIRQDSYDRTSFMPGVLLACRAIGSQRGLTRGIDGLLGFPPSTTG